MALTGLGTLIAVSGAFILNSNERVQKFSDFTTAANAEIAKYSRRTEFCEAAVSAHERATRRTTQLNEYVQSHKNRVSSEKLNEMIMEGSQEAAKDLGLLAGYTADTTGLPTAFHASVNEFFKAELDFWHSMSGFSKLIEKNSKATETERLEILERLDKTIYTSSLLVSSWRDMAQVTTVQGERNIKLAHTMMIEAKHEATMIRIAWRVLLDSTLLFLLLGCYMVLDRGILRKKQ